MGKQKMTGTNIESLMEMLANKDGLIRKKARKSLVAIGKPAVSELTRALQNSKLDQLRWEAAKTLDAIGDIRAIPSLVKALEDNDQDVAWLAAEALKKFKKTAWPALLRKLIKSKPDSFSLRQGAHHVFRNQKEDGFNGLIATLTKALKSDTVPGSMIQASYEILRRMGAKS